MAILLTVLADIKLPEIDEVGDRCWQYRQVIIWHAQSVEQLTVEQLLRGERERERVSERREERIDSTASSRKLSLSTVHLSQRSGLPN